MLERYDLSVLLVTYNHEPFVAEAVRSIIAQEVDAPFEIVVADDGSGDRTREIISRQLSEAGWTRVRYLDHNRRLGLMGNYRRAFAACDSRYVAILEGDDYWLRADKLRVQTAFLDAHPECSLCGNNVLISNVATGLVCPKNPVSNAVSFLGPADVIADNRPGNFSACVYRIETLRSLPKGLFDVIAADWIVNICAARTGLLAFLHEPMSVYRNHPGGLWNGMSPIEQKHGLLRLIPSYDALTEHVFHDDFEKFRLSLEDVPQ